jgi:PAS domain S-box-containing protein
MQNGGWNSALLILHSAFSTEVAMNNPVQILYLEDNPRDAELVRDKLQQIARPHEVQIASNRAEYEAALAQTRFDLILSDYSLPDYDGMAALALAQEKQPAVPFILISGTLGEERAVDCVLRGATDFVLKQRLNRLVPAVLRTLTEAEEHQKRRGAEDALRDSEEKFRSYVERAPDGVFVLDGAGRYVEVNASACQVLGYSREEIQEFHIHDLLAVESLEDGLAHFKRLIETGEATSDLWHKHKDGSQRCLTISAVRLSAVRILGFGKDITKRKQAEAELLESKALTETIVESIPLMLFLKEATDLRFVMFNRAGEELLGYDRKALLGKNNLDLFPPEQAAHFMAKDREVLDVETGMLDIPEEPILTAKKGTRLLHTRKLGIRGPDGKTKYLLGISEDITEQKRAEEEKGKLEDQLRQAQKMEAVGRLAGGVAHDFNNLLMGIMNYTQLCRDRIEPDHPIQEYLAEITHDAERSAEITRQLLAFARKQTIAPRVLDLNDAVAGMLKLLRRLIGEDINLAWRPGADLRPVKLDPSQVDQILANLCVNSRDAIAGVGEITLETGSITVDAEHCARHPEAIPGAYVFLAVSDNGSGMDKETLAQVFEPFFTTKGLGKGTGLGLATVYGIVKQNNGFIYAYSEPGKGTTFKIYLPEIAAETVATTVASKTEAPRGRGETILLVEDEKSLRVTCGLFLEALDYKVLAAETPGEALQMTARHPGDIHVLLTDVVMPGMDGRQLAKRISAVKPGVKVLFMSGYTADVIAQRGVLDEGVQFLSKPFTRDDLACKVREMLAGPTA